MVTPPEYLSVNFSTMNNATSGSYHLGHYFMERMAQKPPNEICQIDAATDQQETNASVLERSVRLARCFRKLGLQPGDVLALGGNNHLDLHIPYYAALLNGLPVVGVDPFYKFIEVKALFKLTEPKIAFCQNEKYNEYARAAEDLGLDVKIVTFDVGECTLTQLLAAYDDNEPTDEFQPAEFDTDRVFAWLVSTSGTTGVPKVAAFKHQPLIDMITVISRQVSDNKERVKILLNLSPVQWISAYLNALCMITINSVKLQTSAPCTTEHVIDIINKFKPTSMHTSPSLVSLILRNDKKCDLTCFNRITLMGAKIYKDMFMELKTKLRKDASAVEVYSQTEVGLVLLPNPRGPIGCCGKPSPSFALKLVDRDTGKEIKEPNVTGELWTKTPCFTEYYKNPEETAKAFAEGGWFKTGDLLYRDEDDNYFFVERIKMLIKCRGYSMFPPELEELILTHAGVLEVCVTSVPHRDDGQRPVACVVRRPGCDVTAREIKDLVACKLSEKKQLSGGVVFMDELPKTSTEKVARAKLRDFVMNIPILLDD